jgi:hypothetical protein
MKESTYKKIMKFKGKRASLRMIKTMLEMIPVIVNESDDGDKEGNEYLGGILTVSEVGNDDDEDTLGLSYSYKYPVIDIGWGVHVQRKGGRIVSVDDFDALIVDIVDILGADGFAI